MYNNCVLCPPVVGDSWVWRWKETIHLDGFFYVSTVTQDSEVTSQVTLLDWKVAPVQLLHFNIWYKTHIINNLQALNLITTTAVLL